MEENNNVNIEQEQNTEVVETEGKESNQEVDTNKEVKTFSQEEVNKMIQERLERASKKADAEKEEAKKLAKMSADEKAKYENDKLLAELAELKADKSKRELQDTALGMLEEKGLGREALELLNYTDADKCKESIDKVYSIFNSLVEKAVDARLVNNTTPKIKEGAIAPNASKMNISKMGYPELMKLKQENPDLYNQLKNR